MSSFRYAVLIGASLAVLAACSEQRQFLREKYTGERKGDPVMGMRRAPVLNPAAQARNMPPANIPAAPVTQIVPQPATAAPYNQYDASGNETGRTNYVKEWFGDKEAAAAPAPVPSNGRKPFRGSVAALQPAQPVDLSPPQPPAIIPQAPATQDEENGVFLPETDERVDTRSNAQLAQLQPAAGGNAKPAGDYAPLATVPKTPERMKAIKQEKGATEIELNMEHDMSMEQKKTLEEEPTELPVTLPQVNGMLKDINGALKGTTPIVQASAK